MTRFPHLIGNARAKAQLELLLASGNIPPLLLFSGPKGVCKSEFAREFAIALIGDRHKVENGLHPDYYTLKPEGKSRIHPIAAIHEMIDRASRPAYSAPCKIFVIEEAHLMPPSSSNALLKLLEEPKGRVYFIATTSEIASLLPTIASRAQQIRFHAIALQEIEKLLVSEGQTPEASKKAAFLSFGSLKKARALLTKEQVKLEQILYTLLRHHHFSDALFLEESLSQIDAFITANEEESLLDKIDPILERILLWQRDCHLLKLGVADSEIFHQEEIPALKATLSYPLLSLKRTLALADEARKALLHNVAPKHLLEQLFLRLIPG